MRRHLVPPLAGIMLLTAATASAQTEAELEQARAWFGEGVAHVANGRHREAVTSFRQVMGVRASPQVRYNLAISLFELGEFSEADEEVQVLLDDAETPESLRSDAADLRLHIEEMGGRLRIEVVGAESGFFVTLDGRELPAISLRRPLRVRTGAHELAVERGGAEVDTAEVTVEQGQLAVVTLDLTATPAEAAATVELTDPDPLEGAARRPLARDWRLWAIVGGAVVAIVAVGVIIGVTRDGGNSAFSGDFEPATIRFD